LIPFGAETTTMDCAAICIFESSLKGRKSAVILKQDTSLRNNYNVTEACIS